MLKFIGNVNYMSSKDPLYVKKQYINFAIFVNFVSTFNSCFFLVSKGQAKKYCINGKHIYCNFENHSAFLGWTEAL